MKRILIAGVGNIFCGDDAFGVEVAQALSKGPLPEGVQVVDFGIRSYDLAFAFTDSYDAVLLVDACSRGEKPGTVFLIEPELGQLSGLEAGPLDAHSLDPFRVLQMASGLGPLPERLYIIGCEPASLESEEGHIGLSQPVRAAVPEALEIIGRLLGKLLSLESTREAGLAPA